MTEAADGVLQCAGVFEVIIPADWRAEGTPGETYVIEPKDGRDIEVNLSVYRPEPQARMPAEALVRDFAQQLGVPDVDALAVKVVVERRQERAFATTFAAGRMWFIAQLWFGKALVLATANVPPGEPSLFREAENLVASIAPHSRRRFRR
ncbi:MAG: hypothetical protein QOC92_3056 [Acidimicrobiaceae bacterium]